MYKYLAAPINLSILDFKHTPQGGKYENQKTINLSILDFKRINSQAVKFEIIL